MEEVWKDIPGYEIYYQVSNLGRVRSKDRLVDRGRTGTELRKGKILKQIACETGTGGVYYRVYLYDGTGRKTGRIHRLVAESFCDKKHGCNVVNHLDGDSTNNKAENLEWTTPQGNARHASMLGRLSKSEEQRNALRIAHSKHFKPVIGTHVITGGTITFESINEASRNGFGLNGVWRCCRGKRKSHKGYFWRYAGVEANGV